MAPFFLFFGRGSPSNSTNQKRLPWFSYGHWASERRFAQLVVLDSSIVFVFTETSTIRKQTEKASSFPRTTTSKFADPMSLD